MFFVCDMTQYCLWELSSHESSVWWNLFLRLLFDVFDSQIPLPFVVKLRLDPAKEVLASRDTRFRGTKDEYMRIDGIDTA